MENLNFITSWQEAHTIVDDAMKKGDRSVSIYISPDSGMSVSVFPWPDEEMLRAAYEQGKISYNDYRMRLGLPPIHNQDEEGSMTQMDCKNCVCMLVCKEAQDSKYREHLREGKTTCCDFYPRPDNSIKKAITAVDKMNSTFGIPQGVYVVEECSELTKELMKEQRKKGNDFSIINEACDVLTTVFVLLHHYGISEQDVTQRILVKCNRALERYEKSGEM